MRVLGYFILCCAAVLLLSLIVEKRNQEVEAPPVPNEERTRADNEVRPPGSDEPRIIVRVVPAKRMDELCADRSKLTGSALDLCDSLEKSKSMLDDELKRLPGVAEIRTRKQHD